MQQGQTQFDLNEKQAFTGLKNGIIRVWNLKGEGKFKTPACIFYEETWDEDKSEEKKVFKGHTKEITALRVAGNFLFSGAHDGTIKQWDLAQHQCVQTIETGLDRGVFFLKVEGPYIFGLADERHTICQWDIATGKLRLRIDLEGTCYSFYVIHNLLFCFYGKKSKLQMIQVYGRGRDVNFLTPPAQIRTCSITAYGSYLGCLA